jgi:hypothetical protein
MTNNDDLIQVKDSLIAVIGYFNVFAVFCGVFAVEKG